MTPSEEVFASMVDSCLANGDLDGAVEVCREMKQALPDLVAQCRVVVVIGPLMAQGRRELEAGNWAHVPVERSFKRSHPTKSW